MIYYAISTFYVSNNVRISMKILKYCLFLIKFGCSAYVHPANMVSVRICHYPGAVPTDVLL